MRIIALVAAVLLGAAFADAQCSYGTVSVTGATSYCSIILTGGKYDVSVTRDASVTMTETISVSTTSTIDDLHFVTITNTSVYPTWVNVGSGAHKFRSMDSVARGGTGTGAVVLLDLEISGNIGESGSSTAAIDMDQVNTVVVGGDVFSPVLVDSTNSADLGSMLIAGSLYGDVTVSHGNIGSIAASGTIGDSAQIKAKNGIHLISGSAISASIQTNYNGGAGDLWYLKTNSGDFTGSLITHNIDSSTSPAGLDIAGDLSASITASGFRKPIVIGGNLDGPISVSGTISSGASITIGGSFRNNGSTELGSIVVGANLDAPISVSGTITSGASITVGDSFRNNGTTELGSLTLGSSGLAGQVIINANDNGGTWGSGAIVTVGGTALSSPSYYTDTPSSLGGGAVGLAHFHMHGNGCNPVNGGSISGWSKTATLTFYGPVTWDSGTVPVLVFSRVGLGSWTDITYSGGFTVAPGANDRELVVASSGPISGTPTTNYKIVAVTDAITCEDVYLNPSVATFEYDLTN